MIYLNPPIISKKEYKYVKKALNSGYIAPVGEWIDKFEKKIKKITSSSYALATINATSAIHLALRVIGIKKRDKVITSTFTFIGGVNPIFYEKARAVFVDIDNYWQIDLNLLEKAIKKEKPKAMIIPHIYGQMAKIDDIQYLAKKYKIFLIEDAAEALGSTYNKKHSGTFGDIGIFSFNGNKIVTTSNGGIFITNNEDFYKKAKFLANQAKEDAPFYLHTDIGYNYRLSNILAAIGVAQLEKLKKRVKKKREIFKLYQKYLDVEFMPEIENSKGNRWLSTILVNNPQKIIKALKKHNIEARFLFKPMHTQPIFKNSKAYLNGNSERIFKQGLALPSGVNLTKKDIKKISKIIKKNL